VSFVRITPIPEEQWGQVGSTSTDPAAGTATTGPVSEGQAAQEWWDYEPVVWPVETLAEARKRIAAGQPYPTDLSEYLTFRLLWEDDLIADGPGDIVAYLRLKSIGLPGTPRHESVPHDEWVTYRSYQDFARALIEGTAQLGDPVPEWTPEAVEPAPQPVAPTDAERIAALEERLATAARCWRGGWRETRNAGTPSAVIAMTFTLAQAADMDGALGV
jgi:hypothetical protein